LGHRGEVQQAERASGVPRLLFTVPSEVLELCGAALSKVVVFFFRSPDGPFGKVRSSTKPASDLFEKRDKSCWLGKVCGLDGACLFVDAVVADWGNWVDVAGLCEVDRDPLRSRTVCSDTEIPEVGSGDDSEVEFSPAMVSPNGWSTSRSLRK
jgi:hypothetical protein